MELQKHILKNNLLTAIKEVDNLHELAYNHVVKSKFLTDEEKEELLKNIERKRKKQIKSLKSFLHDRDESERLFQYIAMSTEP